MRRRLLIATLVVLCLTGCSKKSDGTSTGSLPDGWPSNVPVYPGARVVESFALGRDKQVVLWSSDDIEKVSAFYKEKLSALGVQRPSDFDQGEKRFVMFDVGSSAMGGVTIEPVAKGTKVTLMVSALKH